MQRVLVGIKPVIRVHLRHDDTEGVVLHPTYTGTVWAASIRVYSATFDLCDAAGQIVYTGSVRDLHPRTPDKRTFNDDVITEFDYSPVEDCYVGF